MTDTYRLLNNIFEYEVPYVDFRAMRKQGSGLKVRFADENKSLHDFIPSWAPVPVKYEKEYKNVSQPDIAVWNDTCLVMSRKARDALSSLISSFGEFLPLENGLYLYNSLSSVSSEVLNEDLSRFDPADFMKPTKIVFLKDAVKGIPIFKPGFAGNSFLLCSEEFKQCCISNEIEGLIFEKELTQIFPTRK